jgi:hypothetical protein
MIIEFVMSTVINNTVPSWVEYRIHENCTHTIYQALDESTNAFTRQFVTDNVINKGIARCETGELWWAQHMFNATGNWETVMEGY